MVKRVFVTAQSQPLFALRDSNLVPPLYEEDFLEDVRSSLESERQKVQRVLRELVVALQDIPRDSFILQKELNQEMQTKLEELKQLRNSFDDIRLF